MDSSRRAVESYWRSQMIEGATSEDSKITAVYKLEEICDLLRSSHASTVKQISEFILKRLDHRSPIVKQKALRLIKYAVGKSGVDFRKEMQRNSSSIRQLFHYKGYADLLRGDSLNKAVRDTAHEAISAIFSEDNKAAPLESIAKRIQGFGNTTTMELYSDDKKSFISEVVGFGSASIKQGLSNIVQAHLMLKSDSGRQKGPTLRRSLTVNSNNMDGYEVVEHTNEFAGFGISKNVNYENLGGDFRIPTESTNVGSNPDVDYTKTREDKLLETVVTSGGVRLQPTHDAVEVFLSEASKLDALPLCKAIELKLQSNSWQVRLKAVYILESILRRKDEPFLTVASYFVNNKDILLKCSESPQSSLAERANKVLGLLGGEPSGEKGPSKAETAAHHVEFPDLIDTAGSDDHRRSEHSGERSQLNPETPTTPSILDLFSGGGKDNDPFADVSFHDRKEENSGSGSVTISAADKENPVFFDLLGAGPEAGPGSGPALSVNPSGPTGAEVGPAPLLDSMFSDFNISSGPEWMHSYGGFNQPVNSLSVNFGVADTSDGMINGGYCSALPDIFQQGGMNPTVVVKSSKKQDSRAFDFISDHVAAARDSKKVIPKTLI